MAAVPETWGVAEEAIRLGVSVRSLRDLITMHKPPVLRNGRKVLFDTIAHEALKESLRCQEAPEAKPVRASKSFLAQAVPPSICAARSAESEFSKVLERLTQGTPKKPARRGKRSCSVLPFTGRARSA